MERYYVKRPTGKVFGPFDENAIRLMLKGNKLGSDAQVSTDKESWLPISEVAAFASALGVPADLPVSASDAGLPQPKSAFADLPQSRSAMDLPAPKSSGLDLPRPKSAIPDLPRPKGGGPGLPVPKAMPDLPVSAGSQLPASKGPGPGLPIPKSNFDLPRSSQDNLPSAGSQLPRSSQDNLPGSANPLPAADDDLFGAPIENDDDLFAVPGSPASDVEDDLFAAPVGMEEESDDLFAAPAGMEEESDDLFAAPAGMEEESDDLFAAPAASAADPFGAPAGEVEEEDPFASDDALFEAGPMEDDDLFASTPADDDDFLGGDQGFSFLDDDPVGNDGGLEDWEEEIVGNDSFSPEDLGGGDDWGSDLVGNEPPSSRPSPPSRPQSSQPASPGMAGDPFRPASTGIKPAAPAQEQATTGQAQVADADKKRGLMTLVGVPVLAVLLLGGIGYGVYTAFLAGDDASTEAVVERGPTRVEISFDQLRTDNYHDLLGLIDRGQSGELDITNRGRLLLAQLYFLMRYEDERIQSAADELAQALAPHEDDPTVAVALATKKAMAAESEAVHRAVGPYLDDPELGYFAQMAKGITDASAHFKGREVEPRPAPQPLVNEEGEEIPPSEEELAAFAAEEEERQETFFASRATRTFNALAAAEPTAALPHYWLGKISFFDGEREEGLRHLERGVNAFPNHVASRLLAGQNYLTLGNLNDASEHLRKIIDELSEAGSDKERGLALHLMGMVHTARQENEKAIEMFTRALNTDSSRVDTLRALAEQYERAEMYEEALNFFTTDQNLGQQDPEVMLGIVRSHMGLENFASAIRKLEEGEREFPEDARFPYYLGQLNERRGTFFEARKALERAVEIDPNLLTAHAALALLSYRIDNDPTQGEQHVRAIIERADKLDAPIAARVAEFYRVSHRSELARQWNEEALRLDPNYWEARLALSRLFLDQNQPTEALRLLERARAEGIQDIRLSAYLADAYRQDRQFDRAIEEINAVIARESDNHRYIFIRGRIYFDQGNYATAREDFNNAYQLDTRFHDAYFYVGRTALAEGDYTTATRIFRHVLDYQPDNGNFHYFMGQTFEADGSLNQALESYRRATAVDSRFAQENPHIFVRRGRLLTRIGYTSQGRRDIMRALEIAPDMRDALLAIGETNFREQNYAAAIENYHRALAEDPEDAQAQFELGMSYVYENQKQNGARHLQLAIRYGYENPDIYRTLGYLYRDLGQRRQAVESLKTYLREVDANRVTDAERRTMLREIQDLGG